MPTAAEYFSKVTYNPTYLMGDRVRGKWQGVPFAGTVAIDNMVDTEEGPYIMVFLDLPIKVSDNVYTIIRVKHNDLIEIKGNYESNRKTNIKKSVVGSD